VRVSAARLVELMFVCGPEPFPEHSLYKSKVQTPPANQACSYTFMRDRHECVTDTVILSPADPNSVIHRKNHDQSDCDKHSSKQQLASGLGGVDMTPA
jgi:hypothetical protein